MARLPQLVKVAEKHNLKIISIEDLVAYRMRHDSLIVKKEDFSIDTDFGQFRLRAYEQTTNGQIHLAFTKGTWAKDEPVLTRIHANFISNDILELLRKKDNELSRIFQQIDAAGKGAFIVINQGGYSQNLLHRIQAIKAAQEGKSEPSQVPAAQVKDIGIGAQILIDLGISHLKLLTNSEPSRYVGMSGYGLEITDYVSY